MKIRKSIIFLLIVSSLLLTFSACGKKYKNIELNEIEYEFDVVKYDVPDPNHLLIEQGIITDEIFFNRIEEKLYTLCDGVIYRIVEINDNEKAWAIQKLEYPYEQWDTTIIKHDEWEKDFSYALEHCAITPKGVVKLILSRVYEDVTYYFFTEWHKGRKLAFKDVTDKYGEMAFLNTTWVIDGMGNNYFYNNSYLKVFNMLFGERKDYAFSGILDDVVLDNDKNAYYVGLLDDYSYKGIYDKYTKAPVIMEEYAKLLPEEKYSCVWNGDNDLIVVDNTNIKKLSVKDMGVYSFNDDGIEMDEIHAVTQYENVVYLLGSQKNSDCLLMISEVEKN